jgi:hypothetical protein
MTIPDLKQGGLNDSYFRVVFNSRPSPISEKVSHGGSIFNNEATDWYFTIITSWTDILFIPLWTFLETRVGNHRIAVQKEYRKHGVPRCGKKLAKFSCGIPLQMHSAKSENILTTIFFRLRVIYNDKINEYIIIKLITNKAYQSHNV